MSFTRRTLVTGFALAILATAGLGARDAVHSSSWEDPQPRPSAQPLPTPSSGEPDQGSHRVQRTATLTPATRTAAGQDREALARQVRQVRWVSWVWVSRYLGMGL